MNFRPTEALTAWIIAYALGPLGHHTPVHTPNSISPLVTGKARSEEPEMLLTGDLLFVGDIGRPDLPGAEILDEQVENLYKRLHVKLADSPDHLEVFPVNLRIFLNLFR